MCRWMFQEIWGRSSIEKAGVVVYIGATLVKWSSGVNREADIGSQMWEIYLKSSQRKRHL